VIVPIYTPELELTEELKETERGDKGFGSTGR
jgi:dUTPase